MPILTIVRLTLLEIVRRRLLLAIFVLTALAIALTGFGFSKVPDIPCGGHRCAEAEIRTAAGAILIFVLYMFSFVLAVGSAFLAAPAIAAEVESGVALAILPRPIRRSDVVLGKWLGLALVVTAYSLICCGAEMGFARLWTGYLPPHPLPALAFLVGQGIVILTLALLGSTRLPPITVGISVLVLYGLSWIIGVAGAIGTALGNTALRHAGTVASLILPSDALWRGALYHLEPVALLLTTSAVARNPSNAPFSVFAPPPPAYVAWSVGWVVVVLWLAVASFDRREV